MAGTELGPGAFLLLQSNLNANVSTEKLEMSEGEGVKRLLMQLRILARHFSPWGLPVLAVKPGQCPPQYCQPFPGMGFTGERVDSLIELWNLSCQNEARSWQLVQSLQFMDEETTDKEGKMTFKVSPQVYGQIWD